MIVRSPDSLSISVYSGSQIRTPGFYLDNTSDISLCITEQAVHINILYELFGLGKKHAKAGIVYLFLFDE